MRTSDQWWTGAAKGLPGLVAGAALLLAVSATAPAQALPQQLGRGARPGEVALTLRLHTQDGSITAYEPVLADIEIRSRAAERVWVCLTAGGVSGLPLTIRDPGGNIVAKIPPKSGQLGGYLRRVSLAPGEIYAACWAVHGGYQFAAPGEYGVQLLLVDPLNDGQLLAQAGASLLVRPFDARRLEARCEELFQPIRQNRPSHTKLSLGTRVTALYSVRHDIVLPYLDWMAREWGSQYACRAIKRIGTPRAKALYEALAARNDRAGKAARAVPKMNMPDVSMWDVVCDRPVPGPPGPSSVP